MNQLTFPTQQNWNGFTNKHLENILKFQLETQRDELRVLRSELEMKLRDLNTQLEISTAQKNEFEEQVKSLQQDIQVRLPPYRNV
jgi:chromosome segregation ATPase